MPQFYPHVTDCKKTYEDTNGLELIDASAAQAFARIIANDLRADGQSPYYVVSGISTAIRSPRYS